MALLRVLAIAAVVFVVTRWLRRALGGQTQMGRSPSGKPWWEGRPKTDAAEKPKLKTLNFQRGPHDVLGVPKGASADAVEAAYLALLAKNSPEAVAGMSEEIQALAKRKTDEINEAYAALKKDLD